MATTRIGISGWTYAPWRGTFFPAGVKQADELAYASRQVPSIEINGTFYSLQRPSSYAAWHRATPANFIFSVKGPRYLTHLRRLKNIATPLANFFASGLLKLGAKLGPILWQLPPSFRFDAERLGAFFQQLPRDTHTAAALARRHDDKLRDAWTTRQGPVRPLRHALEVRHRSFETPEFIQLLRQHDIALVVADTAGKWPFMEDVTSDFIYVRLHGDQELYVSGYTEAALKTWARKIRAWQRGGEPSDAKRVAPKMNGGGARDVFVYFDNDVKVRAPYDAMTLSHLLGLGPKPGAPPDAVKIKSTARPRWPGIPGRMEAGAAGSKKAGPKTPKRRGA